jgi:uncharacterized protein YkvS
MFKVKSLIARSEVKVGDIISYPEGVTTVVTLVITSHFNIIKKNGTMDTVSKSGAELTYYGNIFNMPAESKADYESMQNFRTLKLSNQI